jgi:glycosyltransferase involved in cell wall biosynthesis
MTKIDLSIIIGAYNEEKNIQNAISSVVNSLKHKVSDLEIIVVDDGSTDKTSQIVKQEIRKNKKIKLISRSINKGLGYSFVEGLKQATNTYVTVYPGDNDLSADSLIALIRSIQSHDLVVTHPKNTKKRSRTRNFISALYVFVLNHSFHLHLRYFNGPFLCKAALARKTHLISTGHNIYAELLIRLLRKGVRYTQVPFDHIGRVHGVSKAYYPRNIMRVSLSLVQIYWEIQIYDRLKNLYKFI